jgi:hypothetical protein
VATVSAGQPVQFTAGVTPVNPTVPTGTLLFTATGSNPANVAVSPPVPLGASGTAGWANTFSVADTYTVTAQYSGDTNYLASQSGPLQLSVAGLPDFTIEAPRAITVAKGKSVAFPLTLTQINGFQGAVKLSCSGLGWGMSCSFRTLTSPRRSRSDKSTRAINTVVTISTSGRIAAAFTGVLFFAFLSRRRRMLSMWMMGIVAALSLLLAGCNSSAFSLETPVGEYPVTISGSSGHLTHTSVILIKVQ